MSDLAQNPEVAEMYSSLGLEYGDARGLACLLLECQADWWIAYGDDWTVSFRHWHGPRVPTFTVLVGWDSEGDELLSEVRAANELVIEGWAVARKKALNKPGAYWGDDMAPLEVAALIREGKVNV